MVASTDIKVFVHTNNNAPQLQNAFGSMISVLDACLVNGINIGPISSLTASGTTITALFSSAHNLMQYQVIKITGAAQSEFNGEHRILTVPNAQSVTFELAAAPSTTTATGTITASLPPLGWEKPFSSSNPTGGGKAAYRSTNLLLPSRPFLRVVDELDPAYTATYAKYAKVGIVEDMADINTMLGVQAPYDSNAPDKNWVGVGSGATAINGWAKWYYARNQQSIALNARDSDTPATGVRGWLVVGNSDYFYILPCVHQSETTALSYGFGHFESLFPSDQANVFLSAATNYIAANGAQNIGTTTGIDGRNTNKKTHIFKPHNQINQPAVAVAHSLSLVEYSGTLNYIGNVALSGGITPFTHVYLNEEVLRGRLKGFYWLYQDKPYSNYQLLRQGNEIFIAATCNPYQQLAGQVVLKAGDV